MSNDFPYADTLAAHMLASGLARASDERGASVRQIGKELGYKQAVVLSHMATGRVPIPIDRAEDLADILGLDKGSFLRAVTKQRHPNVDWGLMEAQQEPEAVQRLTEELEVILGARLTGLTEEHRAIFREVVASMRPSQRWLTPSEVPAMEALRKLRPSIRHSGLNGEDMMAIERVLDNPGGSSSHR